MSSCRLINEPRAGLFTVRQRARSAAGMETSGRCMGHAHEYIYNRKPNLCSNSCQTDIAMAENNTGTSACRK